MMHHHTTHIALEIIDMLCRDDFIVKKDVLFLLLILLFVVYSLLPFCT
jgi:hypothetical protein